MTRIAPPMLLGQRMSQGGSASWWVRVGEHVVRVAYSSELDATQWAVSLGAAKLKSGALKGCHEQKAANEAGRWLVAQAETILRLAGRRAA